MNRSGHLSIDVKAHGARGDGVTLDTPAINAAIVAAAGAGGGTVVLSAGTYLSFSIRLKSNVTLHLARGAILLAAGAEPPSHEEILSMLTPDGILPGGGTGDSGSFYAGDQFGLDEEPVNPPAGAVTKGVSFADAIKTQKANSEGAPALVANADGYDPPEPNEHDRYQDHGHSHWHNSLIWGEHLENVAITGPGMIDGRGLTWNADPANPTGNKAVVLKRCRHVTLRDFTLFRAGHFAVLATGCRNVTIDNVTLDTNRDGLDIDSCQFVHISNCRVNSPNDDGIVLKSSYALGAAIATEDVTITGCELSGFDMGTLLDGTRRTTQKVAPDRGGPTGRIKFGTESNGGFRRVRISDCTFTHCRGLAIESVDGGPIEDISATNITMRDVTSAPLFIRLGNRARGPAGTPVATVRNVRFSQIVARDAEPRYASLFLGLPGHCIEDLTIEDVLLEYRGGGGKNDARARPPEKEGAYPEPNMFGIIPAHGLYFRHVRNLRVSNVRLTLLSADQRPAVVLEDVHGAWFVDVAGDGPGGRAEFIVRECTDVEVPGR